MKIVSQILINCFADYSMMEGPCSNCTFPVNQYLSWEYEPGDTPLIYAAYDGHENCVKAWLEAGADVNAGNYRGATALIHTAKTGFDNCAETLINAGADVNIGDEYGETALTISASTGQDNFVKLLIESGADVNIADTDGLTPLVTAARRLSYNCVHLLLKAGAFINTTLALSPRVIRHNERLTILLYAAGEYLPPQHDEILDILNHEIKLKHLCREAIRKRLLALDPHLHLFNRIPQLNLPSSITAYLLYYESLDS